MPEPVRRRSASTTPPASRAAVEHLVDLGHRRIAHVAGPPNLVHGRSAAGLEPRPGATPGCPRAHASRPTSAPSPGPATTRELLDLARAADRDRLRQRPDGDGRAVDGDLPRRLVPGELSVTGFDDIEIAAHLQPSLTTVTTDVLAWGRAAATRLLELVDHDQRPTPADLPPARLVVRCLDRPRATRPASSAPVLNGAQDETQLPVPVRRCPRPRRSPPPAVVVPTPSDARPRRARSRCGSPTTPRRSPGARRWSRSGTPRTPTRRSPRRRSRPARPPRRSSAPRSPPATRPAWCSTPARPPYRSSRSRAAWSPLDYFTGGTELHRVALGDSAEQYKSPDGKFYQIPWKQNPVMIFYNKDLFKKAGLDPENPQFRRTTTSSPPASKIVDSGAAPSAISPLADAASSSSPGSTSTRCTPPSPAATQTHRGRQGDLRRRRPARTSGTSGRRCTPKGYAPKEKYDGDAFADKKAAMAVVGPWAIAVYKGKVSTGASCPVPTKDGMPPARSTPSPTPRTSASTRPARTRRTAWDVLKFATSEDQDGKLLETTGQMPIRDRPGERRTRTTSRRHPEYKMFADQASRTVEVPERAELRGDLAGRSATGTPRP